MTRRKNRSSHYGLRRIVGQIRAKNGGISAEEIQRIIDGAIKEVRAERRPRPHVMRAYRASRAKYAGLYGRLAGLPQSPRPGRRRKARRDTAPKRRK
jgi:hypothetical protein